MLVFIVKSNNFIFRDSNIIEYINQVTVTVSKTKSKSLNASINAREKGSAKRENPASHGWPIFSYKIVRLCHVGLIDEQRTMYVKVTEKTFEVD